MPAPNMRIALPSSTWARRRETISAREKLAMAVLLLGTGWPG